MDDFYTCRRDVAAFSLYGRSYTPSRGSAGGLRAGARAVHSRKDKSNGMRHLLYDTVLILIAARNKCDWTYQRSRQGERDIYREIEMGRREGTDER